MVVRPFLIAFLAFALVAPARGQSPPVTSWIDGLRLKPNRPPRPKPSEPDVKRDNSGPFHLALDTDPPANQPEPAPAMTPQLYELTDNKGQRWQHADPTWLRQWVDQVNAQPAPVVQTRIYRGTVQCVNGVCPQR